MVISLLQIAALPGASATEEAPPEVSTHYATNGACPAGTHDAGAGYEGWGWARFCRPNGFAPILDLPTCYAAFMAGQPFPVYWIGAGETGVCHDGGAARIDLVGGTCPAPLLLQTGFHPQGGPGTWCVMPLLQRVNVTPAGAQPICIEDDLVQDNAEVRLGGVGTMFDGPGGARYVITAGDGCNFGCLDGFDANCDGRIGDYCPIEHDRTTVLGVLECLELMNGADSASE